MIERKNNDTNKGISLIIVLWIMAILTVLTTATALMTQGDVASTVNLIKRKGALQLAENGSDYVISLIPDNNLINSQITFNASMPMGNMSDTFNVHKVAASNDRAYVISPVPLIYNNALGNNPYGPVSPGGSGTYYIYEYTTGGIMGTASEVESPQRIIDVAAGWWSPLSESSFGHTMY